VWSNYAPIKPIVRVRLEKQISMQHIQRKINVKDIIQSTWRNIILSTKKIHLQPSPSTKKSKGECYIFMEIEWPCECNEMMIILMVGHEVALWVSKDSTQ